MVDRELEEWEQRSALLLEEAYLAAGAGPGGSGNSEDGAGAWRSKRQHLAVPMDRDGDWLDVGCANGHLLATLPGWAAERGIEIRPHGLELLPRVAALARSLEPGLAERIWTGSIMGWQPPRRFDYVTALEDAVPPGRLADLVDRIVERVVAPGGRLIISTYTSRDGAPRPLFDDLAAIGRVPDGTIRIDRPGARPLITAWIDVAEGR